MAGASGVTLLGLLLLLLYGPWLLARFAGWWW
jgi:hypothetical protein